ncbi:hypothetical protein HRbin15_00238 [bacterium HR15]|nr:hypothetical protein HRbin15_00238 [bacterium HR15]
MAHLLDEQGVLHTADPRGMMALTLDFPSQYERAVAIALEWRLPALPREPRLVVVSGMGGSGIGGDYLRALFEALGNLPVLVVRDYHLPHCADDHTLLFAVSYSGNTEETLACYAEARARNAMVVAISSGGELQARAQMEGIPHLQVPSGQPPRTALGYLLLPMVVLCERWHLLPNLEQARIRTLQRLVQGRDHWGISTPYEQNPAKQLASALHGKLPLLYGSGSYRAIVATRWKGQFNENAKQHAFANTFPELNHNEILGWVGAKQQAKNFAVVALRDPDESIQTRTRIEVTRQLVGDAADWHEVWAEGESLLERLLTLTYLGDFVSLYLAYLNGVDPYTIDYIDRLKAELAKLMNRE